MARKIPSTLTLDYDGLSTEHLETAGEYLGMETLGEIMDWLDSLKSSEMRDVPLREAPVMIYLAVVGQDPTFTIEDARALGLGVFAAAVARGKDGRKNPPAREPLAKRPPAGRARSKAAAAVAAEVS